MSILNYVMYVSIELRYVQNVSTDLCYVQYTRTEEDTYIMSVLSYVTYSRSVLILE